MGWTANRQSDGSFHVVNEQGHSFRADSEDEIHEVLAELDRREEKRKAAEAAAVPDDGLTMNPGNVSRIN